MRAKCPECGWIFVPVGLSMAVPRHGDAMVSTADTTHTTKHVTGRVCGGVGHMLVPMRAGKRMKVKK